MMKAVCLLSGGMDSSTLAYVAKNMGYEIYALHMTYGQRTENRERQCAQKIAHMLGAREFLEISLEYFARIGGSSLTDRELEIADHEEGEEGIPSTYVPFRNANLLSIATSFAESRGADAIFIGVQASDYAGYPDCRPEFIEAFQRVIDLGTADHTCIRLVTPFVRLNKTDILRKGLALGVPYEHTWSCYRSDGPACGRCDSCHYRLEAFRQVGVRDPIEYAEAE
jgi:7-cyano-7-deazaguanine synthase